MDSCSDVVFNLISELLLFPAASLTLIVSVHASFTVVHDAISFQFNDKLTLQFVVLLSLREAINSHHM
jgi:hypothetical protein